MEDQYQELINETIGRIASTADLMPGILTLHDQRKGTIVWMCDYGLGLLGIDSADIAGLGEAEYHARYFNPADAEEYLPKLLEFLKSNDMKQTLTFFQQVRYRPDDEWNWYASSVRIVCRDKEGMPLLFLAISIPIGAMHHMAAKAERLMNEVSFLKNNFALFAKLGNREREILKLMALGKSAAQSASILHIALNTVETHRKNIRAKLNTSSQFELGQYARAFDLI